MGEKTADNILQSVEKSKQAPFARVLFALGIRYVGEMTAKQIADAFPSLDAIANATPEQLQATDEVGGQVANSIYDYFHNERNLALVAKLRGFGLQFESGAKVLISNTLQDKTFVITGTLSQPREAFKARIEQHGGKVSSAISGSTDYLLAGENGGSKLEKAARAGVAVIDEAEFERIIAG
jgi:DNA ligase (NAD+)